MVKEKIISSKTALKSYIKTEIPTLYLGSKTSTVIPFNSMPEYTIKMRMVNLSEMPKEMKLIDSTTLRVSGGVNYEDARKFLRKDNLDLKVWPTDKLATMLAGIASSATGERSFSAGPISNLIKRTRFLDYNSNEIILESSRDLSVRPELSHLKELFQKYNKSWEVFKNFKKAPFPRLQKETDLMIGAEGQLGVLLDADFEVGKFEKSEYYILQLPRWEKDLKIHEQVFHKVDSFRHGILSCEFIDFNALRFLQEAKFGDHDIIIFEIKEDSLEEIYENFFMDLDIDHANIVRVSSELFNRIRENVPIGINEYISKNNLKKKGTDAQVLKELSPLMRKYNEFSKQQIEYCLFGHFGDGHLHFNFLPKNAEEENVCDNLLDGFYDYLSRISVSPFAEHGIGILKYKYAVKFYSDIQLQMFKSLKEVYDPNNIFFPVGYMSNI